MPKTKVKLTFIVNNAVRKATYKQRKKGILKKIKELSTYCGIESCAIIYSPYEEKPEIWPSESGVQRVLGKFRTMTEWEQNRKMLDQRGFVEQSIIKGKERVNKLSKENKEKEMNIFMLHCLKSGRVEPSHNFMMTDYYFADLSEVIDKKLKEIDRKLEDLNVVNHEMLLPHQPQMEAPTNHVYTTTSNQHKAQELAQAVEPQEMMTLLNSDEEPDLIPNPIQWQLLMESFLIGNGNEITFSPHRSLSHMHQKL